MTDQDRAVRIRAKADELCSLLNDAAEVGLHIKVNIIPYVHNHSTAGNVGSGFKALVLVHRETHI